MTRATARGGGTASNGWRQACPRGPLVRFSRAPGNAGPSAERSPQSLVNPKRDAGTGQADVASPEQVILAAQVTQSLNDADQLAPMVAQATDALHEAGIDEPIGTVLADRGSWNSPALSEVRGQGIDALVPTQDRRRSAPRKLSPRQGEEARRIEAVLSKAEGQALSTAAAYRSSSRSSRTPNSSAAATASSAAASPPARPSGS